MNLESHFTILLELLIKSAALTLVGLALLAFMRKASAANRHAVIALLFGTLFLLPLTVLVPPLWSFGLESAEPEPVATVLLPPATPVTKTVELAVAPALESADPVASHAPAPHESPAIPWQALAFVVWLAGAAILLARRAVIAVLLQSVLRQSRALKNERLAQLVRESVEAGGRDAEVRVSTRCRVPLVAGIVRPVILLPVEAEGWSDALVSSALRHELGHIRRRDCVVRLLADIACALHWLNPLVWLAARQLRLAQEQACDDLVLNSGACAEEYAGQLVDVVRGMQRDRLVTHHAIAMAQPSTIETRVIAIMDGTRNRSQRIGRGLLGGVAFAVAMLAICATAQVGGANEDKIANEDKTADAWKRGLAFLAARQNADGSFGKDYRKGSIGLTSLAGLALMPEPSHAGAVERALKFVLQSQQPNGYFDGHRGSMYDHGYATLFIAEALRTGNSPDTKNELLKAVAVIQKSQGPEGGWRYKPQPTKGDSSITSCQVMALAAVRDAGVDVPADVIAKAVGYLKKCQNADGGFQYVHLGGGSAFPRPASAFPRSAAALAATMATREIVDIEIQPDVAKAAEYVGRFLPKAGEPREHGAFFIHGNYYAEQASRSMNGDAAKHWREALREFLLASQEADGSWADKMSTDLATSQACLILHAGGAARPGGAK